MGSVRSITKSEEFRRVYETGKRSRSNGISVVVARGAVGVTRLGLAVPSSSGTAVARNRIRRRVRAAFAQAQIADPLDVVIRPQPASASVPFQELVTHVERAVERAR
jgi:ribonuclease P protein component